MEVFFGISFFVIEIFTFLYYANEESDGVIGGSTKTVQHSIMNISRNIKVPILSSKFLILYFMQWTSAKNFFDLDKKRFCYECLKTWKSYFLAVDPCRWSQHQHAQSCDADSGTCDFRLDLSRLFYFCKFSFVFHAKCSFPACCMNYQVKFTEVKQAR